MAEDGELEEGEVPEEGEIISSPAPVNASNNNNSNSRKPAKATDPAVSLTFTTIPQSSHNQSFIIFL